MLLPASFWMHKDWCTDLIRLWAYPIIYLLPLNSRCYKGQVKFKKAQQLNVEQIPVVAVATHDTGSAVVAVPALKQLHIFKQRHRGHKLEVKEPIINEQALEWNYTNGRSGWQCRFLKNIMGLWLFRNARVWDRQGRIMNMRI